MYEQKSTKYIHPHINKSCDQLWIKFVLIQSPITILGGQLREQSKQFVSTFLLQNITCSQLCVRVIYSWYVTNRNLQQQASAYKFLWYIYIPERTCTPSCCCLLLFLAGLTQLDLHYCHTQQRKPMPAHDPSESACTELLKTAR